GRGLHDEGEAAVAVHRDHDRDRQPLLHLLGLRIELLAELHDVHTLLAERRPDRGRGVGGARGHLQLDVALYLLSHSSLLGCKRREAPRPYLAKIVETIFARPYT